MSLSLKQLHWYGNFLSYTGFSRQNRCMAFGLSNRGIQLKLDIEKSPIEINESTSRELLKMSKATIDPLAPKVYCATLPLRFNHGGKRILYTMMESSKTLHPQYVDSINSYDELWLPTESAKQLYIENKVNVPIYVMPLGVDTERYRVNLKPHSIKDSLNGFVFLSVFKWGPRKGYDILLKAYLEEFSSKDDTSLLIVSRTDVNHKPKVIVEDFSSIKNCIGKTHDQMPHIALYDKLIKERDMPSIYALANAFVLISRGEGFGLTYYEAASSGLPIVGSFCSGQMDLFKHKGAFLVEPESYSKAIISGSMSNLAKHCGFYENQYFPDFGKKSIEAVKSHMRYIYENYSEAVKHSSFLTNYVRENFSWASSIDKVYNRVCQIT